MNLSFSAYRDTLNTLRSRSPLDTEYCDLIDRLTDLLTDYYDNNDTIENNGAEAAEYELAGMEPLPRNSPILWREELLFIPEIRQLFPLDSDGRLTAVSLVSLPYNRNTLPSIFTATPEILKRFGNLEDDEVVALYQAIQNYKNDGSSIADQLDVDLLSKVRTNFVRSSTFSNINYISAVIRPSSAGTDSESHKEAVRYPARRLAFTFARNSISQPILHYPEWQLF